MNELDPAQVYNEWKNRVVLDTAGEKLGSIEDVYLDRDTSQPEWGLVAMGLFGSRHTLVPLERALVEGNRVHVPYDAERVRTAPTVEPQGELSEEEERRLYGHYGLAHGAQPPAAERESAGALPGGAPAAASAWGSHDASTDGDDRLEVHKQPAYAGEVRLGKTVVTEQRELDVPVVREFLVLEHRPVRRRPTQAGQIGEFQEIVIPLSKERVEILTRPVVREEIRVSKSAVEESAHVGAGVRGDDSPQPTRNTPL